MEDMAIANFIFAACMMLLSAVVTITVQEFPEGGYSEGFGPGFYPLILAVVILGLSLVLIYETIRSKNKEAIGLTINQLRMPAFLTIAIIVFSVLLHYIGFLIDSVLFLFVTMVLLKTKPKLALSLSIIFTVVIYVLFKLVLKVPLPEALFF
jgi:hypothetical protein